jgi:DNA adenine methylase
MKDSNKLAQPFFKWVGGKRQIADIILDEFPGEIENYYEPFVGGGAMLFRVLQEYPNLDRVWINDSNSDVVWAYSYVRDTIDKLIDSLKEIEKEYNSSEDKQGFYYKRRTEFNELIREDKHNLRRTVLFLFLNKTCFNGMYRVNRHGNFNTPYNYAKEVKFDYENLRVCSNLLQKVTITYGDYSDALPKENALVYLDPPYRPLNGNGEIGYTVDGFNDEDQIRLKENIDKIKYTCKVVLSNSDTKDGFFDELYEGYNIQRIQARRNINRDGNGREKIDELLVKNF